MNTDFIIWDEPIREKRYEENINSCGNTRHYSDSCKTIKKYAKEQNTIYDPVTNQILYGVNSLMKASGVSDGTCNQINPYIFSPQNICGAGTAGGNRCVPDAYPQAYQIDSQFYSNANTNKKTNTFENFESKNNSVSCDSCNLTEFIIILLLVVFLAGIFYVKNSNKEI